MSGCWDPDSLGAAVPGAVFHPLPPSRNGDETSPCRGRASPSAAESPRPSPYPQGLRLSLIFFPTQIQRQVPWMPLQVVPPGGGQTPALRWLLIRANGAGERRGALCPPAPSSVAAWRDPAPRLASLCPHRDHSCQLWGSFGLGFGSIYGAVSAPSRERFRLPPRSAQSRDAVGKRAGD